MNKVNLLGRLTRDPEIRYSQGNDQMAIARYTLAVDRRFKREDCRFYKLCRFRKGSRVHRKVSEEGNKDCSYRKNTDRLLHEQRRSEGIYNGCCYRGTGICREQGSSFRRE